jgi:hypothetical protein
MRKQAFCYFVLGASLSVLLQNLALRRVVVPVRRPIQRPKPADVIDLAAWKEHKTTCRPTVSAE